MKSSSKNTARRAYGLEKGHNNKKTPLEENVSRNEMTFKPVFSDIQQG